MQTLRNYILKDFFSVAIFSFLLISMVMLIGNLMQISDMVIRKGVNFFDAAKIFLFLAPYLLRFSVPLAFLMGILLAMGRLISDNEVVAIRVAGISLLKILNLFLILGFIFSLILFYFNSKLIPDFHYRHRSQMKIIFAKNVSALIEPGMFLENFQNYILYVSDKDGNKLKNVFIYEISPKEGVSRVIFAKRGEFVVEGKILKMKLEEGFRDESGSSKGGELYRLNFKVFFMDIPIEKEKSKKIEKKASDMTIKELWNKMLYLKKMGIDIRELEKELYERINFSFSVLAFIILGFGVSLVVKHREKSINFVIAFFSAGLYYLLLMIGEALIEYRLIIPFLGMLLPNLIIVAIGGYFIFKNAYLR